MLALHLIRGGRHKHSLFILFGRLRNRHASVSHHATDAASKQGNQGIEKQPLELINRNMSQHERRRLIRMLEARRGMGRVVIDILLHENRYLNEIRYYKQHKANHASENTS